MLQIILDSDTEKQADRLVQWLGQGQSDPLLPDTLIVADMGSGIWLQQQLARASGISANIKVELPGRFVWANVQRALHGTTDRAPFDQFAARWAIYQILEAVQTSESDNATLEPVLHAWRQAGARERVSLATDLAAQFERYLAYRRHWLDQWARGATPARSLAASRAVPGVALDSAQRHEPWLAWLWQQLLVSIQGFSDNHPFDELAARLKQGQALHSQAGRVALFGQLTLSAEQLAMLAMLAQFRPSVWFAHDPSQGFWETHLSAAQAARLMVDEPEQAWLYGDEPAVLGEWGRQCRDALAQMRSLEQDELAVINDDDLRSRELPPAQSHLERLQHAVFSLDDSVWQAESPHEPDASLELHATHSLARQVDVACDRLLAAFDELPDLKAHEVAVFCADIDKAAPLVRSAFGHPAIGLPVQVSGTSYRISATVRALEGFLSLVAGPAHVNAVLDWFEGPARRAGVGLESESMQGLRDLLQAAGVHRDDAAVDSHGALASSTNVHGYQHGIDRLLLGALIGESDQTDPLALGLAPIGQATMAQVEGLGRVVRLLELVALWRGEPGQLRPMQEWLKLAARFGDEWLAVPGQAGDLLVIRDALAALSDALENLDDGLQLKVPFAAFAEALRLHLEQGTPVARAGGAVTVAPAGSLREVPFRVCVLLGFDEGVFPRRRPRSEHDLIALLPAFGDVDSVAASRGWFLRALLNTRDRLIMTWQGRDMRSNAVLNPARPLAELLDYLDRFDWTRPRAIVHEHPLQAFSPRRFRADAAAPSYARHWFEAARALAADPSPVVAGPLAALTATGLTETSAEPMFWQLGDLARALADPARSFLQHAGGLTLSYRDRDLSDLEPLGLETYPVWQLFDWQYRCMQWLADGADSEQIRERLALSPLMPAGAALDPVLRHLITEGQRIYRIVWQALEARGVAAPDSNAALAGRRPPSHLRVTIPAAGLLHVVNGAAGPLASSSQGGFVQCLEPVRRLSMDAVLRTWLQHLLVCSEMPDDIEVTTVRSVPGVRRTDEKPPIIFNRQSVLMHEELSANNEAPWQHIVRAAWLSRQTPQAWFPATASAWLDKADVGEPFDEPRNASQAWEAAQKVFEGGQFGKDPGERARQWVVALWRDEPPSLDQVLEQSLPLYAPIWWSMQNPEQL